jgi:hypothetical protein
MSLFLFGLKICHDAEAPFLLRTEPDSCAYCVHGYKEIRQIHQNQSKGDRRQALDLIGNTLTGNAAGTVGALVEKRQGPNFNMGESFQFELASHVLLGHPSHYFRSSRRAN